MIFSFRYEVGGGHTHVSIFSGKTPGGLGKNGDVCFRNEEWAAFREVLTSNWKAEQKIPDMEMKLSSGEIQVTVAEVKNADA